MKTERLNLLVMRRDGLKVGPVLIVSVNKTDRIQNASQLRDALVRALTKWAQETEDGRQAYEYSGDYFNFGDLSNYADCSESEYAEPAASLAPYLGTEGIENLTMLGGSDDHDLTYDTRLMETIDEYEDN